MRPLAIAWLALAIGCGDNERRCTIRCDADRPCADGTCSAGFCATGDHTCAPSFDRVAAGTGTACAVDSIERLWCWGSNRHHQLSATAQPSFDRAIVVGDQRWTSVSVGGGHICALRRNELWCWGRNDHGQVERGAGAATAPDVVAPHRINPRGGPALWDAVSTGAEHTCALRDGELWCWGAGASGRLGTGLTDDNVPQRVMSPITDWVSVVAGGRHTCARSAAAGLHCWGDGSGGQLGTGAFASELTPKPVQLRDPVRSYALGRHSTCAVTEAGALHCWGLARDGALGDPAVIDPDGPASARPVLASSLDGWLEVASAQTYACGRRADGVWCWGTSRSGGTGDGRWASRRTFTKVAAATSLSVGWNASDPDPDADEGDLDLSCLTADGSIHCWGDNRDGQLGHGTPSRAPAPVELPDGRTWTALAAGPAHACGSTSTDTFCWGQAELGQITGVAAPCTRQPCGATTPARVTTAATSLVAGRAHTCALAAPTVTCWGDSSLGQVGAPAAPGALPPRAVPGTWTALLGGGADGTCATESTQTWCWGRTLADHAPAPVPVLDGALALTLGAGFGCALDAAGSLVCFGTNTSAAFGNGDPGTCGDAACNARETASTCPDDCGPPPLTHLGRVYTAIAAGWSRPFACGLRPDGTVECWGDNSLGQASRSINEGFPIHPVETPFPIPGLSSCTRLAAGDGHACAVCAGSLHCWGDQRHGELGTGTLGVRPATTPRTVAAPAGDAWADVTAGASFTCARTAQGRGFCWGSSVHGALGTGAAGANLPVPVEIAYDP